MKYLTSKVIFTSFFFFSLQLHGQDLFNISNSIKYANFLFTAGEYNLAAREYERIVFLDSTNLQARYNLIKSYKLFGDFKTGIDKTNSFYKSFATVPGEIVSDYGKMLMYEKNYGAVNKLIEENKSIAINDKVFFQISGLMLQENYQEAGLLLEKNSNVNEGFISDYSQLLKLENEFNYKKPGVSIAMSAIIPGSGKFYSGYWKDGLIAFIFVAASAYQSYRGFNKNGIESVYGWIFGGLATGFYIGNLYGSGKAANQHNSIFRHNLHHQVEEVFNSYN